MSVALELNDQENALKTVLRCWICMLHMLFSPRVSSDVVSCLNLCCMHLFLQAMLRAHYGLQGRLEFVNTNRYSKLELDPGWMKRLSRMIAIDVRETAHFSLPPTCGKL